MKKQRANQKKKKREEKLQRKFAKKEQDKATGDDMIAYVDENGNITDLSPEEREKIRIEEELKEKERLKAIWKAEQAKERAKEQRK